eukprot:comp30833_c0_seq1/m.47243 comp30833_c0_seq1/g.47243  ORF comp30833_c0_seq1/g.47243 comp30833_c0_seq1/m.47243 type:complete len:197 (-) comp30833_c0_seq1:550-1140(-)
MLAGKPQDQTLDVWFQEEYKKNKFTILVYYRGKWCPYCKSYLLDWEQLLPQINGMQGKVYGVCSETQEDCNDTVKEMNLNYEIIGDRDVRLTTWLRDCDLIDIAIEGGNGNNGLYAKMHPRIKSYPHGMTQPGVLVVDAEGKAIFSWAIVPSLGNVGGAANRLEPKDVLDNVRAVLEGKPELARKPSVQGKLKLKF